MDGAAVRQAVRGHSVAINAAGHAKDGQQFHLLFKGTDVCNPLYWWLRCHFPHASHRQEAGCLSVGIVEAVAECLEPPKKLWMLGGVTALDVPGSSDKLKSFNDLPMLYRTPYRYAVCTCHGRYP